jgi:pyruvate dehydrogenase E2 component (dihydrolipoamide acetyltransferase)
MSEPKRSQTEKVLPVLMPQAGMSMEEGTIVAWKAKPGEMIQSGQVILEIETDKAVIEVEAVDSGRLARIVAQVDDTIEILQPIAYLADNDSDVDAWIASQSPAGKSPAPGPSPTASSTAVSFSLSTPSMTATPDVSAKSLRIRASPSARRVARELGISLGSLPAGSGPHGRILSTDVMNVAGSKGATQPAMPSGDVIRHKLTPMRRAIAKNLLLSKQSIPHFYMKQTINAEPLYRFYQEQKKYFPCSVNDVIISACARTMIEFPAFRSRLDENELIEYPSSNIGIAVGLESGLVVPVLMNSDSMNLREIAGSSRRITESARNGKIENMGQGLFTISNLGMFGIDEFSAIINPPEASILAVGAMRDEAIVENGEIRPGQVMTLTLSCDHRVIDGMIAARFMGRLKEWLENPALLPVGE